MNDSHSSRSEDKESLLVGSSDNKPKSMGSKILALGDGDEDDEKEIA